MRAQVALGVAVTVLQVGCYNYLPLSRSHLVPSTYLAVTLTESGSDELAPYIGPNVLIVRGRFLAPRRRAPGGPEQNGTARGRVSGGILDNVCGVRAGRDWHRPDGQWSRAESTLMVNGPPRAGYPNEPQGTRDSLCAQRS